MNYASKSGVPGIPNQQPHVPNLQKQIIGHLPQQQTPNVQSQLIQSSSQQHLTITSSSNVVGNSSQLTSMQSPLKLTGNQQASLMVQQQQYNQLFLQQPTAAGGVSEPLALTRISTTEAIKSQNGSLPVQQPSALSPTNPAAFRQQKIQPQQQHVQPSAKLTVNHGQIRSLPIATPPVGAASIPQHPQQAHIPQTPQPQPPPQQQQQKAVPSPQKLVQSTSPAKSIATAAAQPTQMASNSTTAAKPVSAVIPSIPVASTTANSNLVVENQSAPVLPIASISPVLPKSPVVAVPAVTPPVVPKIQTPPMVTPTKSNMKLATINSPRVKQSPLRKTTPTKVVEKEKVVEKIVEKTVEKVEVTPVVVVAEVEKVVKSPQIKTVTEKIVIEKPIKEVKEKKVVPAPATPTTNKINSISTPDDRTNKRKRTKAIPFQSPLPELALITKLSVIESTSAGSSPKTIEDKLTLFYKNEFLAVRNSDGGFFLCQTLQNVFKTSPKIRIRWLSEKGKDAKYSLDFCDVTDIECVLTTVDLDKVDREVYKLPKTESERILNILKKAIDVEKGVVPRPDVTEENPNGCKFYLFKFLFSIFLLIFFL